MWERTGLGSIYQPIINVSLPVDRKRNNRYHRWMHSPLLRLNATIAVKFRRVVGVEAPAMFRRRRHSGRLLGFTVARIRGDSGVVIAADDGTDSAVVAEVQRGERRRRRWQLLGGVADGAAGWSLRRMTMAAWCWRLAKGTFPETDVVLGHRVQLVPGNPTGARPTHSNPRWSPPAMTPPLRSPWLPLPTIPRTFRSLLVGADSRLLFLSILWSPIRSTLCKRGENDHDEGPKNVPPRSQDGTRHAGLSDLMHASLLTDCLSLSPWLTLATHPIFGRDWDARSRTRSKEGIIKGGPIMGVSLG